MIVQKCLKGVHGITTKDAQDILSGGGILCNWWRNVGSISPSQVRQKLTASNLDLHVNNYAAVQADTPYISLTAGCVSRNQYLKTNIVLPARTIAVEFATDGGMHAGYIFYCWLLVGLNPAAEIEGIAEEIRELNTYQSYSPYQTEGEIAAKVLVPANQIEGFEKVDSNGQSKSWVSNPNFVPPSKVNNSRDAI